MIALAIKKIPGTNENLIRCKRSDLPQHIDTVVTLMMEAFSDRICVGIAWGVDITRQKSNAFQTFSQCIFQFDLLVAFGRLCVWPFHVRLIYAVICLFSRHLFISSLSLFAKVRCSIDGLQSHIFNGSTRSSVCSMDQLLEWATRRLDQLDDICVCVSALEANQYNMYLEFHVDNLIRLERVEEIGCFADYTGTA